MASGRNDIIVALCGREDQIMRRLRQGVLALAAMATATLMTGATPRSAAACVGDDCANLCQCVNSWCMPGDGACQENCHVLFPNCDTNHICP